VIVLRLGRAFQWDAAMESFTGDGAKEANTHLAREMRKPYDHRFAGLRSVGGFPADSDDRVRCKANLTRR
jgi:hypothetical protein